MRSTFTPLPSGLRRRSIRLISVIAVALCAMTTSARADWADIFDFGLTQPWSFFVVDNTGKAPTTGVPFAGVVPAVGGGACLRLGHTTVANTLAGGGAAAAVGIVDQSFANGTIRAVLNPNPNDGQRTTLSVFARGSVTSGAMYLLGVDFRTGYLVLQRATALAGQPLLLDSAQIPGFALSKTYFVELTVNGSSLSGRISVVGNATTIATVAANDAVIGAGRAGVLLRTGYSQSGTPLEAIVGTFDNVSLSVSTGTGGPPGAITSVTPIIPTSRGFLRSRFANSLLETSLNNSAQNRLDFTVRGASPGATIRLYADDALIAEQPGGGGGTVSVRTNGTAALVDGAYNLRAAQVLGGVEGPSIEAMALQIDTIAPLKPTTPDLISESDSGMSDTDDITGTADLKISGQSQPGDVVVLLINNRPSKLPSTVANGEGVWNLSAPAGNRGGKFQFSVFAVDRVGNVSATSDRLLVTSIRRAPKAPKKLGLAQIDQAPLPPGLKKTAFTRNPLPMITGSGAAGSLIRVIVAGNGVEHGVGIADERGQWVVKLTRPLEQGEQFLAASQVDVVGNESLPSKPFKITYAAPDGQLSSAALRGTVSDAVDHLSDDEEEDADSPPMSPARVDFDGDGRVTVRDAALLAAWVGREDFPARFDIDEDGDVDADDLSVVTVFVGR